MVIGWILLKVVWMKGTQYNPHATCGSEGADPERVVNRGTNPPIAPEARQKPPLTSQRLACGEELLNQYCARAGSSHDKTVRVVKRSTRQKFSFGTMPVSVQTHAIGRLFRRDVPNFRSSRKTVQLHQLEIVKRSSGVRRRRPH